MYYLKLKELTTLSIMYIQIMGTRHRLSAIKNYSHIIVIKQKKILNNKGF